MMTAAQCEAQLPSWRAVQKPAEFGGLLRMAEAMHAKNVMEIGIYFGGTLRAWQAMLPSGGLLIGLDRRLQEIDERTALKGEGPSTILISGESQYPDTVMQISNVICVASGGVIDYLDVLWIDGDHSYKGVKSDYDNYSPFVREGGLIAFHDIAECPTQPYVGVIQFWHEIKQGKQYKEFISDPPGWGGVGVLTKERS